MRYLLDTHVLLWAVSEPERLTPAARAALEDPGATLFLSAVSAAEMAIKYRLGKLTLDEPPDRFLASRIRSLRLSALPLTVEHAARVAFLPDVHADPFDRLLIAQAQHEDLILLTRDASIVRYPVRTILA